MAAQAHFLIDEFSDQHLKHYYLEARFEQTGRWRQKSVS
jgi:hypothetical protein